MSGIGGNLQSPGKDNQGPGIPSLLGQGPAQGSNSLAAAATFMNTVKNMALHKLTETTGAARNQVLSALFGNQGNNQQQGVASSGGGPQSLLGKPPPLMSLDSGLNRGSGDGLLPVPNQGQGRGQGTRNNYDSYDDYGSYDDSGYQVSLHSSSLGKTLSKKL